MNVYLVNESTTVTDAEAENIASALDAQVQHDFGTSGWRPDVRCSFLAGGAKAVIPVGGMLLHLLDTSDQQGALGYHDEDGNEVPYARVFAKTAQGAGDAVSEVASHELLELAVDPHCTLSSLTGDGSKLYALEVGDPVQGTGYPIGTVKVANFVLPAYFDPNTKSEKLDFRGVLKTPFTLTPGGYASYVDLTNVSKGWQQQFGQERSAAPTWAYRHGQRQIQFPGANSG